MFAHPGIVSLLSRVSLLNGGTVLSVSAVYIDESWSHSGAPSLVLAGYVLEASRIQTFESRWVEMLVKYGIPAFHMVDCAHGAEAFKELTKDNRIQVQTDAIEIIREETAIGFAVTISNVEYSELLKGIEPEGSTSPYTIGLTACLAMVSNWAKESGFNGDLAYFFEAGHKDQAFANKEMTSLFQREPVRLATHYASHTFGDKLKYVPLQAADVLAWLWGNFAVNRGTDRPLRQDLKALLRPHDKAMELDYPGELAAIAKKLSLARHPFE